MVTLSGGITPTQAATDVNLLFTSGVGVVATLVLAELIKDKSQIPTSKLAFWGGVFFVVTAASVYSIYKSSK